MAVNMSFASFSVGYPPTYMPEGCAELQWEKCLSVYYLSIKDHAEAIAGGRPLNWLPMFDQDWVRISFPHTSGQLCRVHQQ